MRVHLRDVRAADSAVAWAICRAAVLDGAGAHYTEAQRRAWMPGADPPAWLAERLAAGRGWLAGREGRAEGLLVASGLPQGPPGAGPVHLDLFFVRPEARGTGVASALLARFDGEAAGRPCTAHASLFLRPILEARGWRVIRADPSERGGEVLMRFAMERAPG